MTMPCSGATPRAAAKDRKILKFVMFVAGEADAVLLVAHRHQAELGMAHVLAEHHAAEEQGRLTK